MSISFIVDLHIFCGCNIMVSAADSSFYRLPHRCIRRYGHKGARSPEVLSDLSVEILCCLGGPTWPDLQSGCLELTRSTMFPAVCQSHKFRSMMTLLGFTLWVNKLVQKDTCLHCCKDPCPLIRSKGFSLIFWGLGLKPCSLDSAQPQSAYVRNHPQPSAAVRDLMAMPIGESLKECHTPNPTITYNYIYILVHTPHYTLTLHTPQHSTHSTHNIHHTHTTHYTLQTPQALHFTLHTPHAILRIHNFWCRCIIIALFHAGHVQTGKVRTFTACYLLYMPNMVVQGRRTYNTVALS